MTHISVRKVNSIVLDNGLSPGPCLNQSLIMVYLTLRNKLPWNVYRNSYMFIQENVFEIVVCGMSVISSRPQCVEEHLQCFKTKFTQITHSTFKLMQQIRRAENASLYFVYRSFVIFFYQLLEWNNMFMLSMLSYFMNWTILVNKTMIF